MLVDSHCHLDRLTLEKYDNNLEGAINAALDRDIKQLLCVGISVKNRQAVMPISLSLLFVL